MANPSCPQVIRWQDLPVPSALHAALFGELPTVNGPPDYERAPSVTQANDVTIGPQGVLTQAEWYLRGVTQVLKYQGEFNVPFLYLIARTNMAPRVGSVVARQGQAT